jgi:ribosomal protein S27AE
MSDFICPHCGNAVFEVYFEDRVRRWRCTYCYRMLSETEYEQRGVELLKRLERKGLKTSGK